MTALESAIQAAGGQTSLARRLGVAQQMVWNWLNRGKGRVPAEYCPAIERETGVRCEELRPDIDWGVLRRAVAAPAQQEADRAAA